MKITNKTVVDSVESLNQLSELKLPVKTAFKLAKISKEMNVILETYNEVLSKLQQEHVEKEEDGTPKMIEDANNSDIKRLIFADPAAFAKGYQELLEIETEVKFEKLKLEELGDIEVTPTTLYPIEWLIED